MLPDITANHRAWRLPRLGRYPVKRAWCYVFGASAPKRFRPGESE